MLKKLMVICLLSCVVLFITASFSLAAHDPYEVKEINLKTPDELLEEYQQAPEFEELVENGEIPPLLERLPKRPPILVPFDEPGSYGGTIYTDDPQYTNFDMRTRYVSEPLVDFQPDGMDYYPNLAENIEINEEATEVTVYLREGIKWSDGVELTVDDIIFSYEDILLYAPKESPKDLIHPQYQIGGQVPEMSKVDDYTLKVHFARTNPNYANWLHSAFSIYPKHFLKEIHPEYNPKENMTVEEQFLEMDETVEDLPMNPDAPVIGAWMTTEAESGNYLLMERNPYYWKVDPNGKQLPYIDKFHVQYMNEEEVRILNIMDGSLNWSHHKITPGMLAYQKRGGYRPYYTMWPSHGILQTNLAWVATAEGEDKKLAELIRDEEHRFLRALSHAIDRKSMAKAVYGSDAYEVFNLADVQVGHFLLKEEKPVGRSKLAEPLWERAKEVQRYDLEEANNLLDELGLTRDENGMRRYDDGSVVEIDVGTRAGDGEWEPMITMLADVWEEELGIKTYIVARDWSYLADNWLFGYDIPFYTINWTNRDWFTDLNPGLLYERDIFNWITTNGEEGVEPYEEIKEPLTRVYELAEEHAVTVDPDEKLQLSVEATEIILEETPLGYWASTLGKPIQYGKIYSNDLINGSAQTANQYSVLRIEQISFK